MFSVTSHSYVQLCWSLAIETDVHVMNMDTKTQWKEMEMVKPNSKRAKKTKTFLEKKDKQPSTSWRKTLKTDEDSIYVQPSVSLMSQIQK